MKQGTIYRVSSRSYEVAGRKTYIGRVRFYNDGHYLFSESTGICRLTPELAQDDARRIAADRLGA